MLDAGSQFKDYRILECLGQGGAGTVYRALHFGLQREVALKIALASEAAVEERVRFLREARALARLSHPNVVRILDFGEEGEALFFTMELAPGMSLDRRLREGKLCTLSEARELERQLLEALAAVHESGVIHRDVKPANVLMLTPTELVLSDFGLARDEQGTRLTRTGKLMGTLPYLPPELGLRREVDARGDLYQAGVLFHELLTGEVPFDGQAVLVMLSGGSLDPGPAARALADRFGPETGAFFRRAVEPSVDRRFQSAVKMLKALDTLDTYAGRIPPRPTVAKGIAGSAPRPPASAQKPRSPGARPRPASSARLRTFVVVLAACTASWLAGPDRQHPARLDRPEEVASPVPAPRSVESEPPRSAVAPRPLAGERRTLRLTEPPAVPSDRKASPVSVDASAEAQRDVSSGSQRELLSRALRSQLLEEAELPLLGSPHGSSGRYTAEIALVAPQEYETAQVVWPRAAAPPRVAQVNGRLAQLAGGRVPIESLINGNNWLTLQLEGAGEPSSRPLLLVKRRAGSRLDPTGAARWFPPIPDARALDHELGRAITAEPESPLVKQAIGYLGPAQLAAPGSWEAAWQIGLGYRALSPKCRDLALILGRPPSRTSFTTPTGVPAEALPADGGARSTQALQCLNTALALNPRSPAVWTALASAYYESCRFSDSIRVFSFVCAELAATSTGTAAGNCWLFLPAALDGLAQASPEDAPAVDGLIARALAASELENDFFLDSLLHSARGRGTGLPATGAAAADAYLDSVRLLPGNQEVLKNFRERQKARRQPSARATPPVTASR